MHDFALVELPGKPRDWTEEVVLLSSHFSLLSDKGDLKRFKTFLKSDFPNPQKPEVQALFAGLYPHFIKGTKAKLVKIVASAYEQPAEVSNRRLIGDMKRICERIVDFMAYLRLEKRPEEKYRLVTHALQHRGVPATYVEAQKAWADAASALPAGTQGAYHRWAAGHAGYYSLDIQDAEFDEKRFNANHDNLYAFYRLHEQLYLAEVARNRLRPNGKSSPPLKLSTAITKDSELTNFYLRYNKLYDRVDLELKDYFSLKQDYLETSDRFAIEHRIAGVFTLSSFLRASLTNDHPDRALIKKEQEFWSEWLLDDAARDLITELPRFTLTNYLHGLLMNGRVEKARFFLDRCIQLIPFHQRFFMSTEGEIALLFYSGRYAEVVDAIKTYLQKNDSRDKKAQYGDRMRLHIFNVESLLYLCVEDEEAELEQKVESAINSLTQYLKRNEELYGQGAYKDRFRDFIHFSNFMLRYIRNSSFDKSPDELYRKIDNYPSLMGREWFLQLIDKIAGK